MPKFELNSALKGLSGMIDNWVYKRVDGELVLTRRPTFADGTPTPEQAAHRERFLAAAAYAKKALGDPVLRPFYVQLARERGKPSRLFSFAVADFFGKPEVTAIDVSGYHGQTGESVKIEATDDTDVASVQVVIRDTATSTVIEQGGATRVDETWTYVATTTAPAGAVLSVTATAKDRPGNEGVKEVPVV
jgi:hypothetical protein